MNAITFRLLAVLSGLVMASCAVEDKSQYSFGRPEAGSAGNSPNLGGANSAGSSSAGRVDNGTAGRGEGGSDDPGTGGVAGGGGDANAGVGGMPVAPPPDACALEPCENGGTCRAEGAGFSCDCAAGYSGEACQIEIDECEPNPCANGVCMDGVGSFTCVCADGFEGKLCDGESNECEPNPCTNGGTCRDGPARFSCDCPAGYSGTTCELRVSGCVDEPCLNGGDCQDGAAAPMYTCTCPAGYTGNNCQTNINECSPNPCNGGTCTDKVAGFTCECPAGYTGPTCVADINECMPTNPCQHGTCTNTPGSFTCDCGATGYSGKLCQVDVNECSSGPCQHGGTCTNSAGSFSCNCAGTGYSGATCQTDVNECSPTNPCQHGGVCTNRAGSFSCNCAGTGYSGTTCQTDVNECSPNPCQHGGSCTNSAGSFSCNCAGTGYSGTTCQTDVNECSPNPCQNSGTCVNGAGSYTCACAARFTGKSCEFQKFRGIGASTYAHAVSADGSVVVGYLYDGSTARHQAVRFAGAGPLQYLPTPGGSDACLAYGVTANGATIVGDCIAADPPATVAGNRPFRYTAATGMVLMSASPMAATQDISVNAVSDDGNVLVGHARYQAVRWSAATGWVLLGRLSASGENQATGVNRDGTVIVGIDSPSGSLGWRWTAATGQLELTRPSTGNGSFNVFDVSPNGNVIVGESLSPGASSAVRWLNGTPATLGPGNATATSADGSVVVGTDANGVATVWNSSGAHTLASLLGATSDLTGWTLFYAADISDDGKVVVGTGSHGGVTEGWVAHLP